MLFLLVILGAWMGWVESVYGKPEKPLADAPLSKPPEMYLRPELIPVKGDGLPAVAEAEKIVSRR